MNNLWGGIWISQIIGRYYVPVPFELLKMNCNIVDNKFAQSKFFACICFLAWFLQNSATLRTASDSCIRNASRHQSVCSYDFSLIILSILKSHALNHLQLGPFHPFRRPPRSWFPCHVMPSGPMMVCKKRQAKFLQNMSLDHTNATSIALMAWEDGQCDNHVSNIRKVLVSQNGFRLLHRNRYIEYTYLQNWFMGKISQLIWKECWIK